MTLELTTRSRRRARRARRSVVRIASLLLLLIALTYVLPEAVGLSFQTVTDDAVSATIDEGSAVVVDSVPVADLKVGDVITYPITSQAGTTSILTRRIAEIDGGIFRTRDDTTGVLDPWTVIRDGSRQDAVIAHVPHAGVVLDAFDGQVRGWLTGVLAGLVLGTLFAGSLATRRERSDATRALPAFGTVDDPAATGVRVPAPRVSGEKRRDSTV